MDTFARWKVVDPLAFFQTVNNVVGALARLDDIIDPAVRNFITSYPLIETVRMSNRKLDTYEIGMDNKQQDVRVIRDITAGRREIIKGYSNRPGPN